MIAKFLPYLKSHRWRVGLALAQVFLVAGFELLKPWPLQIVIDDVLGGKAPAIGGPVGDLLSLPAATLLLLACIGIVLVHFGVGGLTCGTITRRSGSGRRWSTICAATSTRICSGCRSAITAASGSAI